MRISAVTDIGRVREVNQDAFYVEAGKRFCIIADGMGGHNGGEVASQSAVSLVRNGLSDLSPSNGEELLEGIKGVVEMANRSIYSMAWDSDLSGMGTTLVICYHLGDSVYIANIGDSRAYHMRGNELRQVTEDHSVVWDMLRKGSITKEQAHNHPKKNVLTRALGTERDIAADSYTVRTEPGDKLLLCSDGVHGMLSDEEILEMLLGGADAQAIVDEVNKRGARDNVTAVVIEY